jgi:hypothetical protein
MTHQREQVLEEIAAKPKFRTKPSIYSATAEQRQTWSVSEVV